MSPRSDNAVVIIGSGPGIGTNTAAVFAANKFNKVALVARNPTQLDKDAESVKSAANDNITVKTYSTDVVDPGRFTSTLKQISQDLGTIEVVLYNAAIVSKSHHLQVTDDELIRDFKLSTIALNNLSKWAMPQLVALAEKDASAQPTLIVTSSHLPEAPETDLVSLSVSKAAQKNFARSLRMEFEPKGVHVALLSVAGYVFDHLQFLNAKYIARQAWELYAQPRGSWTEEVRIEEP
ncbi:NAD(P)-binding protein [Trichoderma citrinoviride]|uniref:NAD(P)-binding protein n=1 Tax=Trichoderma citrinoviride TaxID=58853 RepID=A0A2T4BA42_9HYPO|nr:NAD(P)-binding protein [Trichoderma citrinoviride]PTB66203.1 NAD(P)-binding protein [Trichoderma citrinoviride]